MNHDHDDTPSRLRSGKPAATPRKIDDGGASFYLLVSCALHAGLLVTSAGTIAPLGETLTSFNSSTDMVQLHTCGIVGAEREEEPDPPARTAAERYPDGRERVDFDQAPRGSMGQPDAGRTHLRYAVAGPADNPDPHLARRAIDDDYEDLFHGGPPHGGTMGGSRDAPVVPQGRDDSLGDDVQSDRGNRWGDDLGSAFGSPGVGVGPKVPCAPCGGVGRGVHEDLGTVSGGPTGTEKAEGKGP
jgi:hypothetical protein